MKILVTGDAPGGIKRPISEVDIRQREHPLRHA
jgi:hypothetical protein